MQRFGRWREAAHIVSQVRSGAVMGVYGQYYEITLALQRAVQGRYDESESNTCGGLKNSPPRFVTLRQLRRRSECGCDCCWRAATTTLGTPFTESSR